MQWLANCRLFKIFYWAIQRFLLWAARYVRVKILCWLHGLKRRILQQVFNIDGLLLTKHCYVTGN